MYTETAVELLPSTVFTEIARDSWYHPLRIISEVINFVLSNSITCNCIFFHFLNIPRDSKVNIQTYIYCRPAFRREKFWGFCQTLLKGRYITEFVFLLPFIFTLQNLHDKWCGAERLSVLFLKKLLQCLMKWNLANNRKTLTCSGRRQNNKFWVQLIKI